MCQFANTNNICDQHKLYKKIEKHGVIPVTINDSNNSHHSHKNDNKWNLNVVNLKENKYIV